MKCVIVFCVLSLAALAAARPDDKYTDRYDNLDLDQVLGNDRLLVPYMDCLLEKGKCAPEGKELKGHIKEALEQKCAKCTPRQEEGTRKVIKHLINNKPDAWKELSAKYDPDNKYTVKYEQELREIKA